MQVEIEGEAMQIIDMDREVQEVLEIPRVQVVKYYHYQGFSVCEGDILIPISKLSNNWLEVR